MSSSRRALLLALLASCAAPPAPEVPPSPAVAPPSPSPAPVTSALPQLAPSATAVAAAPSSPVDAILHAERSRGPGDKEWVTSFHDWFNWGRLARSPLGGVVALGTNESAPLGRLFVLRLDDDGAVRWATWIAPVAWPPPSLAVDSGGFIGIPLPVTKDVTLGGQPLDGSPTKTDAGALMFLVLRDAGNVVSRERYPRPFVGDYTVGAVNRTFYFANRIDAPRDGDQIFATSFEDDHEERHVFTGDLYPSQMVTGPSVVFTVDDPLGQAFRYRDWQVLAAGRGPVVVSLAPNGDFRWAHRFVDPRFYAITALAEGADGHVFVAAKYPRYREDPTVYAPILVELDARGNEVASLHYEADGRAEVDAILPGAGGTVLLVRYNSSFTLHGKRVALPEPREGEDKQVLMRISPRGELLASRVFHPTSEAPGDSLPRADDSRRRRHGRRHAHRDRQGVELPALRGAAGEALV